MTQHRVVTWPVQVQNGLVMPGDTVYIAIQGVPMALTVSGSDWHDGIRVIICGGVIVFDWWDVFTTPEAAQEHGRREVEMAEKRVREIAAEKQQWHRAGEGS